MASVSEVHGVLVVDKPRGPTSHDVVAWARRALGTKAVGHAGTLDPMATGVLVLAVGEGTKLVPYLTADDKEYELELVLGTETDTLDAEGEVVAQAAVPALDEEALRRAMAGFVGEQDQRPPIYSAIKVDGEALHRRARRGDAVEVPMRRVTVHALALKSLTPLRLRVHASKGFYVRSLGRDLARALGTVGHLGALRRVASGSFRVAEAISGEALSAARSDETLRPAIRAALVPLVDAARAALPAIVLDEAQARDARAGRVVRGTADASQGALAALFGPAGELVAIAERRDEGWAVRRGFRPIAVDG